MTFSHGVDIKSWQSNIHEHYESLKIGCLYCFPDILGVDI